MLIEDLPDWFDRHHVEIVRTHATTLDGPGVGKYTHRKKFLDSLPNGHAIADTAIAMDIAGTPHLTHWHDQRVENFGDILMKPDLETLISDGTNAAVGHCISDFTTLDGEEFRLCPRTQLKRMVRLLAAHGYAMKAAFELEFYLYNESFADIKRKQFKQLGTVGASEMPTMYLLRNAYHATPFMSEVIKRLEWQGIGWEAWNDEAGVGQIELNINAGDPLAVCDDIVRTKQVLYEVALDMDMAVTFMAAPSVSYGSGMHAHHSLTTLEGNAAFFDSKKFNNCSDLMNRWLAGQMANLSGSVSFLCPTMNSYRRFKDFSAVPMTSSWSRDNRSTALRLITNSESAIRIENRIGAADLNPYLALATTIAAGLAGLEHELPLPDECEKLAWGDNDELEKLPTTITKAIDALAGNQYLSKYLGRDFTEYWVNTRRSEWLAFHTEGGDPESKSVTDWEYNRYFQLV
jgi:glutamine synthetase